MKLWQEWRGQWGALTPASIASCWLNFVVDIEFTQFWINSYYFIQELSVFLLTETINRMCTCRWTRLTGTAPVVEHTRLNVREFMLNPVEQVSSSSCELLHCDNNFVFSVFFSFLQYFDIVKLSVEIMRCWCGYLSGARCRWDPVDATAKPSSPDSVKSRMVFLFIGLATFSQKRELFWLIGIDIGAFGLPVTQQAPWKHWWALEALTLTPMVHVVMCSFVIQLVPFLQSQWHQVKRPCWKAYGLAVALAA